MRSSISSSVSVFALLLLATPALADVDYSPYSQPQAAPAGYAAAYTYAGQPRPVVMPAFRAQQISAQTYGAGVQVAQNYQQPAIPNYLPATANSAQPQFAYDPQQNPAYATYQPQQAAAPVTQAYQQQAYAYQAAPQAAYATTTTQTYQQQVYAQPQAVQQPTYAYAAPQVQVQTPAVQVQAPQVQVQAQAPAYDYSYDTSYQQPAVEAPSVSLAAEPTIQGLYLGLRTGLTLPQDTSFANAAGTVSTEHKSGWLLNTAVGYAFKPWAKWVAPRAEAEFGYQRNSTDTHSQGGATVEDPNAYGEMSEFSFLANGYLDFTPWSRKIVPYVGAGVGGAFTDFDRHGTSAGGVLLDDNDFTFAYQAGAGFGIPISDAGVIDIGYRYQQALDHELTARDGTTSSTDVGQHMILLGLRENI